MGSAESADRPDGRSRATTGDAGGVDVGDYGLEQARERRLQPGAEQRVNEHVAAANLGEVELPGLRNR